MRIISDFHDYYDSLQEFEGVIYNRKTTSSNLKLPLTYSNWMSAGDLPRLHLSKNSQKVSEHSLLLAGKLYPFVTVEQEGVETQIFFSYDKARAFFEEEINAPQSKWERKVLRVEKDLALFFSFHGSPILHDFTIQHGIVIASTFTKDGPLLLNPSLKALQFQHVLGPYQVYQELDMWVSGVLANQEVIPDMDNKSKILAHGFDIKTSFRKM